MNLLTIVLLLMLGLLISSVVSHYIPFIPTALTQVIFGIIIAIVSGNYTFEIEAEWFLILFVAPLLYNDGKHFSREELWGMRTQIVGNAFILVILTTLGCGFVIHWLIPGLPLAAALALAAILSPTDPVAVSGIAKRISIPEKVMVLVKGESLINDASGLVAFKYALAAAVTGYFSMKEALIDFSYTFLVGAIAGVILGLLITFIRFRLRSNGINDSIFHSLLQIISPFGIYIITEDILHASGVIAVVAAGIMHSIIKEHIEIQMAEVEVLTENTWSVVLYVLTGFVFLLLGMDIPSAMVDTISAPEIGNWKAFGYIVVISFTVLGIRFLWTLFSSFYNSHLGKNNKNDYEKTSLKTILTTTLTGVRGAVTMAGILTLPIFMDNGELFPSRSLLIFIAAGVILLLLILATIFLPLLCKKENIIDDKNELIDLSKAKNQIQLSAIRKIKAEMNEENEAAALELINEYTISFQRNLSKRNTESKQAEHYTRKINEVQLYAIDLQRKYINNIIDKEGLDNMVANTLTRILDIREEALEYDLRLGMSHIFKQALYSIVNMKRNNKEEDSASDHLNTVREIQLKAMEAAITGLEEYAKTHEHPDYVYAVILDYEKMRKRFKRADMKGKAAIEKQKEELRLKVLDTERAEIRKMFEAGDISSAQGKELRRFINHVESVVLYEYNE